MKALIPLVMALVFVLAPYVAAAQQAQDAELTDLISEALKEPKVLISMCIQFLMGLGLGYFSIKALKYIVALILILVIGMMLSIWSIGSSPESLLGSVYETLREFTPQLIALLQLLGIMTIGPVSLGFILGVIIALIKK